MKRFFFLAVAATMAFAACNKTEVVYPEGPQEISFTAVSKVATKAPVDGTTFSTGDNMDVVAYLSEGGTSAGTYFTETTFAKNGTNWTGGKYWPLTPSTLNFLAVTNTGGGVTGHVANEFTTTASAQSVASALTGNDDVSQTDLMFAAGHGNNTLGNYPVVSMVFKHALSWITFKVKNGTTAGGPTITVNSITLNDVAANGTLTVTNPKYAATAAATGAEECTTENLTASWTPGSTTTLKVLKSDSAYADALELTNGFVEFGKGVLVVPGNQTSFTINYTVTDGGNSNTFNYTHTITGSPQPTWDMAKKYTYNVTITLNEIQITPSITDWTTVSPATEVPLS